MSPTILQTTVRSSCIGKVLEKVINLRLTDWAETQKFLNCNQSGFRANHSTQDNLFKLIEAAKTGFQNGLKTGMVLFDVEKAFDKTPHSGILRMLNKLKCPSKLDLWIKSFLSNRFFVVEMLL
jgi:hypothetical protein